MPCLVSFSSRLSVYILHLSLHLHPPIPQRQFLDHAIIADRTSASISIHVVRISRCPSPFLSDRQFRLRPADRDCPSTNDCSPDKCNHPQVFLSHLSAILLPMTITAPPSDGSHAPLDSIFCRGARWLFRDSIFTIFRATLHCL